MKHAKNCKKLVQHLINKSFRNLKDKRIFLIELDISDYSASTMNFPFFGIISVSERSKKYSRSALIGLLAHELSHLSIIRGMSFFEGVSFSLRWIFLKKARVNFETKADRLAIRKGYGKELIKLRVERFKGESKKYIDKVAGKGYLLPEEIKQEMENRKD